MFGIYLHSKLSVVVH